MNKMKEESSIKFDVYKVGFISQMIPPHLKIHRTYYFYFYSSSQSFI